MDCCIVCGGKLFKFEGYSKLHRVTSDCKPFNSGGELFLCTNCGLIQKQSNQKWLNEISCIYAAYDSYYQGLGHEQMIFDSVESKMKTRSEVLVRKILENKLILGEQPSVLDIGCGNGNFLREFGRYYKNCRMSGYELNDAAQSRLKKIRNFITLYTGSLNEIDQKFNLISMIHSLEHFIDPLSVIKSSMSLIDSGAIFIQVCNSNKNPFDLIIADHLIHLDSDSLKKIVNYAGYALTSINDQWIHKELSAIINAPQDVQEYSQSLWFSEEEFELKRLRVQSQIERLQTISENVNQLCKIQNFGIFGTSIAAVWLNSGLSKPADFYVDEDPYRVGLKFLGSPILHPSQVPIGSTVYIGLEAGTARSVYSRLSSSGVNYVLP